MHKKVENNFKKNGKDNYIIKKNFVYDFISFYNELLPFIQRWILYLFITWIYKRSWTILSFKINWISQKENCYILYGMYNISFIIFT